MTAGPPRDPGKDDAVARAAALVEREDAAAREAIARPARAKRGLEITVALLAVANILGWAVFPPRGPDATDPRTPAAVERDLRLTIGAVAEEVESWRLANGGRLPANLNDAGVSEAPVEYARLDSATFQVRGTDGAVTLTYRSGTSVAEFVAGPPERRP